MLKKLLNGQKNTPNGEQIAFINDKEAAQLKAMGGSGEEIVEGVRSYQNFLDELSSLDRARALGQIPVEDQGSSANRPGSAANTARLRAKANDNRRRAGLAPLTEEQFNAIPGSRTFLCFSTTTTTSFRSCSICQTSRWCRSYTTS